MDENKISCKECKRNNGFWINIFRTIKNADTNEIGGFLMIVSFIIGFITLAIKLTAIFSTLDVILISCGVLFILGMILNLLFW